MRYVSLFSGIEAATVAWHPLGWTPIAFSEIDAFPRAVLAHHYPDITLHGDMTQVDWSQFRGKADVVVGGSPCQAFSLAGLRKGLADPRGNLALAFLAAVDRIRPKWVVWENVPGILSSTSHDAPDPCSPPPPMDMECDGQEMDTEDEYDSEELHAFQCFLAGLSEIGYGVGYRVYDAQYAGLAQRRERVFVVGYLGDWRRAAAVLLDRESMSGNPPPSREKGKGVAGTLSARTTGGGGLGTDFELDGELRAYGGNNQSGPIEVATACNAKGGSGRMDFETETFITHSLRGEGFDASEDGTERGTHLVPVAFDTTQITSKTNRSNPRPGDACHTLSSSAHAPVVAFHNRQDPDVSGEVTHPLGAKDNGLAIAFSCKDYGADAGDIAPTLRAMGHADSHQNGGGQLAVTTLAIRGRGDSHQLETRSDGTANAILTPNGGRGGIGVGAVHYGMAVRRLTPRECERLQGFPDDYTLIQFRGKPAKDGPRYKAIGNSMAVPVMRWIGERIDAVHNCHG